MKCRNGFVSNSSSSSFIIGCEKIPTTFAESLEIWFGDKQDEVAPVEAKYLFQNMKNCTMDFDKMMALVKATIWEDIYSPFKKEDGLEDFEIEFLEELVSDFQFAEQRVGHEPYSYCSWITSPIDAYVKDNCKEEKYVAGKFNTKYWTEEKRLQLEWYAKPEIREKWIAYVEDAIKDLKQFPVHMQIEVEDDSTLGASIEHEFNWSSFPAYIRFSHH